MLTLGHVVAALTGSTDGLIDADGLEVLDEPLMRVVIDSREVVPGALFVALPGERVDGHAYIAEAFRRGAVAALVERDPGPEVQARVVDMRGAVQHAALVATHGPVCLMVSNTAVALQKVATYWRTTQTDLRVVGVTGSVGKTVTKELIASVLARQYQVHKNLGNFNNEIGLPLTLLALQDEHQWLVAEMGMYDIGDIALLAGMAKPLIGVVTNVHPVHLARARTLERITQAKSELVLALPEHGTAVLNYDDARVRAMAERTHARVLTFGRDRAATLCAEDVVVDGLAGVTFNVRYADEVHAVRVALPGAHSVYTALAAIAVGLAAEMSWPTILAALEAPQSEPLRLIPRLAPGGYTILDDTYNASPTSVVAALELLGALNGRRVAVLGDMFELGSEEEDGHRVIGRTAAAYAELVVAVGTRAGQWVVPAARAAGLAADAVVAVPDGPAAAAFLRPRLNAGDYVLVKGSRGMRLEVVVDALLAPQPVADVNG